MAADGFGVMVAFWAQESEEGLWYLYIASPIVDKRGKIAAYGVVLEKMNAFPTSELAPSTIKLIGRESKRLAKDAKWLQDDEGPTWIGGSAFADAGIDRAYLYPPIPVGAAN